MADVITPSVTRKSAGVVQTPGRERQAVLDRLRLGDLLDLAALGQCERPGLHFG